MINQNTNKLLLHILFLFGKTQGLNGFEYGVMANAFILGACIVDVLKV